MMHGDQLESLRRISEKYHVRNPQVIKSHAACPLQRVATNVASMMERIAEPVDRVQAMLAQRPEVLARIAAVSQQIQQINRIAEPVARIQNAVAVRSDANVRIAEVSKRTQQANHLPALPRPKV